MNEPTISQVPPQPPSATKIVAATVVALIVASVLLVVAILPAEYGIDPLGTGKALGLTKLGDTSDNAPVAKAPTAKPTAAAIPEATISPILGPPVKKKYKWGVPGPHMESAFISQPKSYKLDSREINLGSGELIEIKYNMKQGGGLIYSWTAEKPLLYEFHGEPDVRPAGKSPGYAESYEFNEEVGMSEFHGTFIAPKSGIHGWAWENTTSAPIKLKLVSAGFYDWIQESRNGKQTAIDPIDPK